MSRAGVRAEQGSEQSGHSTRHTKKRDFGELTIKKSTNAQIDSPATSRVADAGKQGAVVSSLLVGATDHNLRVFG